MIILCCDGDPYTHSARALSLARCRLLCAFFFLFFISHAICRLLTFYLSFGRKTATDFQRMTFVIFQIRFRMVDRHLRAWKYVITSLLLLLFTDWKMLRQKSFLFVASRTFRQFYAIMNSIYWDSIFSCPFSIQRWFFANNFFLFSFLFEMGSRKKIDNVQNYGFLNSSSNNNKFVIIIDIWKMSSRCGRALHLTLTHLLLLFLFSLAQPVTHLIFLEFLRPQFFLLNNSMPTYFR